MSESVRVAVRVRPFNSREKARNAQLILKMEGYNTIITPPKTASDKGKERTFTFDHSYWSHDGFEEREDGYLEPVSDQYADQARVFADLGQGVLDNAWNGYNCSLFAYGQTGSGKSYSMVGYGKNKGIVPVTCERLFEAIHAKSDPGLVCQVTFSMLEIYNEQVQDLLANPKSKPKGGMKVRQHPKKGFYVDGLRVVPVQSFAEIETKIEEGTRNRTIAATNMNATSSRAHTIVTINFSQKSEANGTSMTKTSSINLVDLAGSERAESTGATGDRLKEGAAINKSLSTLGNVISALVDVQNGKKVVIPFRDSVLTCLLKNALGGNSKTIMIAALSPADINYDETLSTLRFADRVKSIKTKAVVNETPTERLIRELREENAKLLEQLNGAAKGGMPVDAGQGLSQEEIERVRAEAEEALKRQLEDNAREMEEMKKSWQQRLEEERQKAEAAETEARARKEQRQHQPHLWNMNEDPALAGVVEHFLNETETKIGNGKTEEAPDIVLKGLSIAPEHAIIQKEGNKFFLKKMAGHVKILVNGRPVDEPVSLNHNDRILFGPSHLFCLNLPNSEAAKSDSKKPTWEDAQEEIAKNSGFTTDGDMSQEQVLLQEELVSLLPHVFEANAMGEEFGKKKVFELALISPQARGLTHGSTEVMARMCDLQTGASWLWSRAKFLNRKSIMQEMYEKYVQGDSDWDRPQDEDPFWEPLDTETQIGFVNVYMQSLGYMLEMEQILSVTNYRGEELGHLEVALTPCDQEGNLLDDEDAFVEEPEELIGRRVDVLLKIDSVKGLPSCYKSLFCKYQFIGDAQPVTTSTIDGSINVEFKYKRHIVFDPMTHHFVQEIMSSPVIIEVWGQQTAVKNPMLNLGLRPSTRAITFRKSIPEVKPASLNGGRRDLVVPSVEESAQGGDTDTQPDQAQPKPSKGSTEMEHVDHFPRKSVAMHRASTIKKNHRMSLMDEAAMLQEESEWQKLGQNTLVHKRRADRLAEKIKRIEACLKSNPRKDGLISVAAIEEVLRTAGRGTLSRHTTLATGTTLSDLQETAEDGGHVILGTSVDV